MLLIVLHVASQFAKTILVVRLATNAFTYPESFALNAFLSAERVGFGIASLVIALVIS